MDDQYKLMLDQVNNLTVRRQSTTAIYLSVNTALTGAMAFLFKDGLLSSPISQISVLTLLFSGIIACSLWRRLIIQFSMVTAWWYSQLRLAEETYPSQNQLLTKEYLELYQKQPKKKGGIGMTRYEISLIWLFICIYSMFGAIIAILLIMHI